MKEALKQVSNLVERFERNIEAYRSPAYNETQLRREFIDPLFEALGWDVANKAGHAEQYKDVVHEDAIKVAGATKAPDYCFRIGGVRKFFLETKKPSVDIKGQVSPAYQLRRYAWSAKLPLSMLTDFEEMAIYDCRVRPKPNDKPGIGRIRLFTYHQYVDSFEEIYNLLSKEAVLKGSFDKFAESEKQKRGTTEVDAEFLREIESWRETLAKNIAIKNPRLSVRELNFSVQLTIDRIIFLRMCEDRGIEKYGQIQTLLNGTNTYHRLREIFYKADDKYNSGLFDFRADRLTPELKMDDNPLKEIFKNLYYPDSPYEFSVLGADILGHVYEQFLGKVIRLTEGHRAKIEEKPEVRKAGGVYYTPTYIVEYIVKNTVGKLCEGKTPRQISSLRILDPACGSGSFLLGAYQYLLNYHRDWYQKDGRQKHSEEIYQGYGGQWYLTTREKKRILLNNIYGVDIDPQAVEVTKLSLLLKVLEGENQDSLERQIKLFKERALPDLGSNIKCGNSLIGPDFYQGKQMNLLDSEESYRINAFDWEKEFPEIMKHGGFDAVIGNPPWGADIQVSEKPYFRKYYKLNSGKFESYIFFIEKASALLNGKGIWGFIVPSYWISRSQTEALRKHLCGTLWPNTLIVLPENVFAGVRMDSCITVASRHKTQEVQVAEVLKNELTECSTAEKLSQRCRTVSIDIWQNLPSIRFNPRITSADVLVIKKLELDAIRLGNIVDITQGLTLYRRSTLAERFGTAKAEEIVTNRLFHSDHKKDSTFKKELLGRDVSRYSVTWNRKSWVSYGSWLAHAVDEKFFKGPRLVIQKLRNPMLIQRLVVGYLDDDETYSSGVLLNTILKPEQQYHLFYIMGLLNSKTINYWFRKCVLDVSVRVVDLARIPIQSINFSNQSKKARHDKMVKEVEQMLSLQKQLAKAKTPDEKTRIKRQIDSSDYQIDNLVYELYGLMDQEIKIVEDGTR